AVPLRTVFRFKRSVTPSSAGGFWQPNRYWNGRHRKREMDPLSLLFRRPGPYSCPMPSFDIVSQVNSMEIENAVNQAKKELANRFDFKGSKAEIVLEKNEIKLTAENDFKVRTLNEMV